jgi:hypothetical protein
VVKLLTRPGCEACTRGKFILRRLKHHVPFTASVVNILKQQQYLPYSDELPVILVEEEPVCRGRIVERDLRRAILEVNESIRTAEG